MPSFEEHVVVVPAHWVPAIVNDDVTGLDYEDCTALENWLQSWGSFSVGDVSEPYFSKWHDAKNFGVLACDCVDMTILITR